MSSRGRKKTKKTSGVIGETQTKAKTTLRSHTLYGAVSGQYTSTRSTAKFTTSFRDPVLAPQEVLFQSAHAPVRYYEKDIYFANEDLPEGGQGVLPDSDLLAEVHRYASLFYEALAVRARQSVAWQRQEKQDAREKNTWDRDGFVPAKLIDERSMDETALLAFGILLEEASRQVLGAQGDLVFTEADVDHEAARERGDESQVEAGVEETEETEVTADIRETDGATTVGGDDQETTGEANGSVKKRSKRRKLSAKWVAPDSDNGEGV